MQRRAAAYALVPLLLIALALSHGLGGSAAHSSQQHDHASLNVAFSFTTETSGHDSRGHGRPDGHDAHDGAGCEGLPAGGAPPLLDDPAVGAGPRLTAAELFAPLPPRGSAAKPRPPPRPTPTVLCVSRV
ncbi:hypothetical protein [Streptomyces sp. JJ38]|uniref:hypothetical protein n=1 Tax=Streptomyces sp. JJ38 TaxID=2738128 RepID=UPI001C5A49E6|nr:hypothetical protein [Streptomyces sp. JJ38]MBW1596320.1 hypothetical protein [Streptomyces sp. JJ38]